MGEPDDGNAIGARYFAGGFGGIFAAFLGCINISIATDNNSLLVSLGFSGVWILSLVMAGRAPSARAAWRRLFLTAALFCFLFPVSAYVAMENYFTDELRDPSAADGYGFLIIFSGMAGFFLGTVLAGIGWKIGRKKSSLAGQELSGPAASE